MSRFLALSKSIVFLTLFISCATNCAGQNKKYKALRGVESDTVSVILWHKTIVRRLALSAADNSPLLHLSDSSSSGITINKLIATAVRNGSIQVFGSLENDTINVSDSLLHLLDDTIAVAEYEIIEDWDFNRDSGQIVVNMRYIAPCGRGLDKAGSNTVLQPLFFIKFAQLAPVLKQYMVPKNPMLKSCLDFFYKRAFSSKIISVGPMQTGEVFDQSKDHWVY